MTMTPSVQALRFWLMRRPRPTSLACVAGKETHAIELHAPISWARVAETVDSLDADQVRALDLNGTVIRAVKPSDLEDVQIDDGGEESEPALPLAPVIEPFDPETARFKLVANLIADAYRHSNEVAFAQLATIVDRMARRAEASERTVDSLRRVLLTEARDRFEAAEEEAKANGEPGLIEQLAGAFAGGQAHAAAAGAASSTSNGKA